MCDDGHVLVLDDADQGDGGFLEEEDAFGFEVGQGFGQGGVGGGGFEDSEGGLAVFELVVDVKVGVVVDAQCVDFFLVFEVVDLLTELQLVADQLVIRAIVLVVVLEQVGQHEGLINVGSLVMQHEHDTALLFP